MSQLVDNHPLGRDFPELKDRIHELKTSNTHFSKLFDEYESVDRDVVRAEQGVENVGDFDSLSPVAPFRIVNIGKSEPDSLADFIAAIEDALGVEAKRNLMDIQPGDVLATWSDTTLLRALVGKCPSTPLSKGVPAFVDWYKSYYGLERR